MGDLLVLGEDEVRRLLPLDRLDRLAEAVGRALVSLSERTVSVPPRIAAVTASGLLGAMPGYVAGGGLAAKLVTVYPGNPEVGLASHQALMAVFDESTGSPLAVMGATYLTAVRTAVTSVIAAGALARPGVHRVAVLGAGVQGATHLAAAARLLDVAGFAVSSRDRSKAELVAAGDRRAAVAASAREAVEDADVVFCCTDSADPVLDSLWIRPGTHVGSVGSGAEIPRDLLGRARIFVESLEATGPPPAGAVELQSTDPEALTELGAVLSGRHKGRTGPEEITVFKSTGHAVEDIAAAALVLEAAVAGGIGTRVQF